MEIKGKADIDETVEILTGNKTEEFYRLERWTVLSARRFIKASELKPEAYDKFIDMLDSAMDSL